MLSSELRLNLNVEPSIAQKAKSLSIIWRRTIIWTGRAARTSCPTHFSLRQVPFRLRVVPYAPILRCTHYHYAQTHRENYKMVTTALAIALSTILIILFFRNTSSIMEPLAQFWSYAKDITGLVFGDQPFEIEKWGAG